MKILQISYSLSSGGAERFVVDLSNELSKKNNVHLLCVLDDTVNENDFYKKDLTEEVKCHCAYEKGGLRFGKLINLYKYVKRISPDIVHLHGTGMVYFFLLSILLYRKPKYFETLHNKADIVFGKKYSFIAKLVYKLNLVKLCTISHENKNSLERFTGIMDSHLVYNGRETPTVSNKIDIVRDEVRKFKKNKTDIVFIHIARFAPAKNQQLLIESFNKLYKDGAKYILLVFGAGFDSEEGLELRKNANPNIHFLGTRNNIIDYIHCSDAFCLSSLYEGMPISLIEALACGCTPISTPVSGVVDVIQDGETGYISKDFSYSSYINAIKRFLLSGKEIRKEKLKEIYNEKFSITKCAGVYTNYYHEFR